MKQKLRIEIDDRERNQDLLGTLYNLKNVEPISKRLEIGDFQIDDAVVVERKTVTDFAVSLIDGRLFSQASRMVQSPMRPALIVEGNTTEWESVNLTRPCLQGSLISLMLIFDIPVLQSSHPQETAHLLYYIAQQLLRAKNTGMTPIRKVKAKRKPTRQRRILQSLPGVGPDRAKQLLEHFGSVRACLTADPEELASVQGIGPVTAQKIVEAVEESQSAYHS